MSLRSYDKKALNIVRTLDGWMDGWMDELNVTFTKVRPIRQAETTVMRRMALVARMKLPSNMAAPGIEPGSRG